MSPLKFDVFVHLTFLLKAELNTQPSYLHAFLKTFSVIIITAPEHHPGPHN